MNWLKREIEELKSKHLYRELKVLNSPQGKNLNISGRRVINFSSNDYLCLASHFDSECSKWGMGSGASRLISGNFEIHEILEEALAKRKGTEAALLFSTGYMANIGTVSSLASSKDLILSDELNHASLIDGCRLSRAKVLIYPHKDVETLEHLLSKHRKKYRHCFIVTDSVFSMDGDIAPIDKLFEIKKIYNCTLIVDDAHATGVVGWSSFELFGIKPDENTVIVGTLGKALGTFGAFVCGTKLLREYLINKCRSFIFTTAPPPIIACQTLKNLEKVPARMKKLKERISYFRKTSGIKSESAIFPVILKDEQTAIELANYLLKNGFFTPAIRPPTVKESRIRISLCSEHTKEEINRLWETINRFLKAYT